MKRKIIQANGHSSWVSEKRQDELSWILASSILTKFSAVWSQGSVSLHNKRYMLSQWTLCMAGEQSKAEGSSNFRLFVRKHSFSHIPKVSRAGERTARLESRARPTARHCQTHPRRISKTGFARGKKRLQRHTEALAAVCLAQDADA